MLFPLPPELVREIIYFTLSSAPPRSSRPEDFGCSTKPSWLTLNALSLTSRTYRALALEAWFHILFIESPKDLEFVRCCWPEVGSRWTRHLHCVQTFSTYLSLWDLSGFLHLSSIRLDWFSSTITPSFYSSLSKSTNLPFLNFSSSVEHLDLRGLSWPTPQMLQNIPHTPGLEHLKTLKMKQDAVWCGLCGRTYMVPFKDTSSGVVYGGGYGLPIDYAPVLTPFEYLEEVVITVPNCGFAYNTLGHTPTPNVNPIPDPDPEMNSNPNLWVEECDNCMKTNYENDTLRQEWVDRKRGIGVCHDDNGKKDARPPKLRRVEWQFYDGF